MANKYDKILGEYRENDNPLPDGLVFSRDGYSIEMKFLGQLVHTWTVNAPSVGTGTIRGFVGMGLPILT